MADSNPGNESAQGGESQADASQASNSDAQKREASPESAQTRAASPEDTRKLVTELEAQLKEKDSKYLYLYAEFENFKKRALKERADLLKFGWEPAVRELLQVVDNLERALEHMPSSTDKTLSDGLHMVLNQFKAILAKQGVQQVESVQQSFNPELHEAVAQESSDHPPGTVVKEHMRGYTLHGRLLRPARVVVSGGKSA